MYTIIFLSIITIILMTCDLLGDYFYFENDPENIELIKLYIKENKKKRRRK